VWGNDSIQVTATAAPGFEAISRTVTLEIVFLLDVVTLDQERQPVEAEVRGSPEPKALQESVLFISV
jgi:hypothetical protein